MFTRITEATLPQALDQLARRDADFARALREAGRPPLRWRPAGFPALLRIIVAQQVSLASAQAIWTRLEQAVQPMTAGALLACSDEALRAAGLSRPKLRYARSLAEAISERRIDLAGLEYLDDETAIKHLVQLKGLGRWSAEVYLLFSLGRPDVWPADDVGLMIGVEKLKGLTKRPDAKVMRELAEPWRPLRGVAARLLWHYRGHSGLPMREADPLPE